MIKLNVNNNQKIKISQDKEDKKINVDVLDKNGQVEYSYTIEAYEMTMLLNYFLNCKDGTEPSDYIR